MIVIWYLFWYIACEMLTGTDSFWQPYSICMWIIKTNGNVSKQDQHQYALTGWVILWRQEIIVIFIVISMHCLWIAHKKWQLLTA